MMAGFALTPGLLQEASYQPHSSHPDKTRSVHSVENTHAYRPRTRFERARPMNRSPKLLALRHKHHNYGLLSLPASVEYTAPEFSFKTYAEKSVTVTAFIDQKWYQSTFKLAICTAGC